ncbi:MAG TPA: hypothetical protein VGN82_14265 [Bosea sp. (in: a-proteobacteria)]|jgi:hypothetical protein|uniref:hypothetical protein n=1 Tax=Bosea sp. (in: a-proteobacteria) TaxID=1871050 RepID=UPI002E1505B4|nr:hypothetical protein [Bosea sp. (in: a-proteobacteria)]
MARAPLYTVTNLREEARFAEIGIRKVPLDAGSFKELPISEETALELAAQGFKVARPDGKVISVKREAKAKDA